MIHEFSRLNEFWKLISLLLRTFSQQDEKIKINGIINGSLKFNNNERYNTELCWLWFFFLYDSFPYWSQSSQLILKNLIFEFPKNIKPPLIWLMYSTLQAIFWIMLPLMKSKKVNVKNLRNCIFRTSRRVSFSYFPKVVLDPGGFPPNTF